MKKRYRYAFLFLMPAISAGNGYAQEAKLMFTFGHTRQVSYALFSPDGKKIITSSADKTGKIWDVATGNVVADLRENKARIYSEEFSPDGKRILTASFDSTAKVWDINTGRLILDLRGHKNEVWGAHYSKDAKRIGTCSKDSTAKVWDASTGKLLVTLSGHNSFIQNLSFSPDRKSIVTASYDSTARLWDAGNGMLLKTLNHKAAVYSAQYSNNGKYILTASADSTAKIWDATTGILLKDLKGHSNQVWAAEFSSDSKLIVTTCMDSVVKLWNTATGQLIFELKGHKDAVWYASFSPDNKKIATASDDRTVKIWDVNSGNILLDIPAHQAEVRTVTFSKDGKKIVSASDDRTAKVWDSKTGDLLLNLKGYASGIWSVKLSPDGSKILMACGDNTAKIWDIKTGSIQRELKGHADSVKAAVYSPDGKKIITISNDRFAKIWDAGSGDFRTDLKGHKGKLSAVQFSNDGKIIATASVDGITRTWNGDNGVFLKEYKGDSAEIMSIAFNHAGNSMVTTLKKGTADIWNLEDNSIVAHLTLNPHPTLPQSQNRTYAEFNKDDTKVVSSGVGDIAIVWDAHTGKQITSLEHSDRISSAKFSGDGKKVLTASFDNTAKIWDAENGRLLTNMTGHSYGLTLAEFTKDGSRVITSSRDNTSKIWDAETGKKLMDFNEQIITPWLNNEVESGNYNSNEGILVTSSGKTSVSIWDAKTARLRYVFFTVNNNPDRVDYLILDKDGHYDGTTAAMKLLYFTCGTEFISLDQAKDKLWKQGLAERIMHNETIEGEKLSEINICSSIPQVEEMDHGLNEFRFKITPRADGLGETHLFLNDILVKRYQPPQLKKVGKEYFLTVSSKELQDKFVSDTTNYIRVVAYAARNDISSRGVIVPARAEKKDSTPPNLYAVMIGVGDYKGEDLDLQFPDKDANDLSNSIGIAAKKLFDSSHVFVYNLTTGKNYTKYPGKIAIKKTIDSIGKRSRPNDMLLIFFAGHGVLASDEKAPGKKKLYFLTADASDLSIQTSIKDVGISTDELTAWINPSIMKARKRVLIFDACNSGSAVKDIGKRNDDKRQQTRVINKLNEQSGMYILSASASDQPAYEMSKYGHGLLTYALLHALKFDPEILDKKGNYINVAKWFIAGREAVIDLSKENGARQQPDLFGNTSFPIGKIDDEVLASIKLQDQGPLFAHSSFHNRDDSSGDDNLELTKLIDQQLNDMASRGGGDAVITYNNRLVDAPEAWSLLGRYTIQDDMVSVDVSIKQNKKIQFRFPGPITRKKADIGELAGEIVKQATEWILNAKNDH